MWLSYVGEGPWWPMQSPIKEEDGDVKFISMHIATKCHLQCPGYSFDMYCLYLSSNW